MNKHIFFQLIFVILLAGDLVIINIDAANPINLIKSLIQNNVLGAPVVHKVTQWDFDPEISVKRRKQYYQLHGYRGEKLIERIGLGIDGRSDERLAYQQARDQGKLGGLLNVKNSNN